MEETEAASETCRALNTLDESLMFLLVLIAGVLISFAATAIQRNGIAQLLCCGSTQEQPDVFPLRWKTGVMTAGAAGFFALLSRQALDSALGQEDCAQRRSARASALAAALAFAATLIRLDDLEFIQASRQSVALEESLLPE